MGSILGSPYFGKLPYNLTPFKEFGLCLMLRLQATEDSAGDSEKLEGLSWTAFTFWIVGYIYIYILGLYWDHGQ